MNILRSQDRSLLHSNTKRSSCDLEAIGLDVPTTHHGGSIRLSPVLCRPNVCFKVLPDLNNYGVTCRRRPYSPNSQWYRNSRLHCPGTAVSQLCHETRVGNKSEQDASLVVHSQKKQTNTPPPKKENKKQNKNNPPKTPKHKNIQKKQNPPPKPKQTKQTNKQTKKKKTPHTHTQKNKKKPQHRGSRCQRPPWTEKQKSRTVTMPWDPLRRYVHVQGTRQSTKLNYKKGLSALKAVAPKVANGHIYSYYIRVRYIALLIVIWVLQLCHCPSCWTSTWCKMKPWQLFWEQQKTRQ